LGVALMVLWGWPGAVLFVPAGIVYLIGAVILRLIVRLARAAQVDRAIEEETQRINRLAKSWR